VGIVIDASVAFARRTAKYAVTLWDREDLEKRASEWTPERRQLVIDSMSKRDFNLPPRQGGIFVHS
jgi:hypothetical protein